MTSFNDFHEYAWAPRVGSLRLSPDGSWLALAVQTVGDTPAKYLTSIWRVDTEPGSTPVRLTRSAEGEGGPEFLPDGSLAFVSRRTDGTAADGPDKAGAKDAKAALWLLPADGGEARRIAAPGGGVEAVAVARDAGTLVYSAPTFRGTAIGDEDAAMRKARTDAGVSAILHESGRLRYWDHDLSPEQLRLLAAEVPAPAGPGEGGEAGLATPKDLTPAPGHALDEQGFELTPDGRAVVTGWMVLEASAEERAEVAVIDVATGERRTLLAGEGLDFESPRVSPDGRLVVARRSEHETYDRPADVTLVVTPLAAGEPRDLLAGFDRQPGEAVWAPDSGSVFFSADH
jgi:dipeptidyl aminopeptidase/acylaminoacyl peptidase